MKTFILMYFCVLRWMVNNGTVLNMFIQMININYLSSLGEIALT